MIHPIKQFFRDFRIWDMRILNGIIIILLLRIFAQVSLYGDNIREEQSLYQSVRIGIMIQGQSRALYSWFGHAGIILSGPADILRAVGRENQDNFIHAANYNGDELMFDYGNFDTSDKNFILRLPTGDVNYYKFYKSFRLYKEANEVHEKRGMDIYWLNLDVEKKQKFVRILFEATNPDNQSYKYDFYFDNCLTRIRDQLNDLFDGRLQGQITGQSEYTPRQLLRREIG
ncbi:MAG: DUF4105 domain-containing protein, partial [Spirochaetota bacterium]